jgi:hypothetical protein
MAPVASASVELAGNAGGDQVLLHRVLDQRTRPLFVGTRAPGGAFGPLVPITADGGPWVARAAVDGAGAMVAGMTAVDYTWAEEPRALVSTRAAGGAFESASAFGAGTGTYLQVATNARGDAVVALRTPGRYRFRPSGGTLGPPTELPGGAGGGLAVDLDGTVAFVWSDSGSPTQGPRTFESHRPPGGDFGPPVEIPNVPFAPYFATASNGRALLVWDDGHTIWAAERPPGGHVGAPFEVAQSHDGFFNVEDVEVAPSGAAAITFGSLRYYLTVRDPGGSFGKPERVSNWPARVAVDDRGDAAVAWQARNHTVSGAYGPAGGVLGKPLRLARARPLAPGGYDLPAVTIAGNGRATAAWEESDGARVQTFVRSFDRSVRRRAALVDTVPSFVREGPPSACRPAGASIVKSNRQATVFFTPSDGLRGCLLARGAPVRLAEVLDSTESTQHGGIALKGPLVAHANDFEGHGNNFTEMRVTDLRDSLSGVNRAALLKGTHATAELLASRLKANGAVAFVDLLGATKHVKVWGAHATLPRLVDSGRRINENSLGLRGSIVSWRNAGKLHRARLR